MSPIKVTSDDVATPISPWKAYIFGLLGAIGLAGAVGVFGLGRPLLAAFSLCAGLSALSLGMFFRPGKQSYNASCIFFAGFTLFGIAMVVIGVYALVMTFISYIS